MTDYTDAEIAEIRAAMREEAMNELRAAQRSQNGLVKFLQAVGLHVLARMVASLTCSAWKRFKSLIGWG